MKMDLLKQNARLDYFKILSVVYQRKLVKLASKNLR